MYLPLRARTSIRRGLDRFGELTSRFRLLPSYVIVGAQKGANSTGVATGYVRVLSGSNGKTIYTGYGKSSGDTARDMSGMLAWLGILLAATFGQTSLGVGGTQFVKSALPNTFRLTVETYGGDEYYGWDITVTVILRDLGWTFTP